MGLVKKLLIKNGFHASIINAPESFSLPADELPSDVEISNHLDGEFDFILLFAHNQKELKEYTPEIISQLKKDALFWVAYPKKSSKINSDITRDTGWESLKELGYQGVSLISIDQTWSAFRLRNKG
ncbi:hypothetical protein [Chengkuizengella sediminis]|uniref:hypothetical protein n=1 Tax=Chengkuizengella sediminis TaxID=1885917 RepID=UPI0013898607|nr:hypothetical protein [Chengkuizengella sediminis]NDI35364.1 hypothetical protein [Chengkuizengella sediminis]